MGPCQGCNTRNPPCLSMALGTPGHVWFLLNSWTTDDPPFGERAVKALVNIRQDQKQTNFAPARVHGFIKAAFCRRKACVRWAFHKTRAWHPLPKPYENLRSFDSSATLLHGICSFSSWERFVSFALINTYARLCHRHHTIIQSPHRKAVIQTQYTLLLYGMT